MHRSHEGIFETPMKGSHSLMNGAVTDPEVTGQVFEASRHAHKGQNLRSFLIDALNVARSPAAVARLITLVVVDAVNGVLLRWHRTHIGNEILEGISPTRTNGDSLRAVGMERRGGCSCASRDHVAPRFVFPAIRHAVCDRSGAKFLRAETPTRARAGEVVGLHERFFTAIAQTSPFRMLRVVFEWAGQHDEPTKSLTNGDRRHPKIMPYFAI